MSKIPLSILLLGLIASIGCSTVKVDTAERPGVDLPRYQTFGQAPLPPALPSSLPSYGQQAEVYVQSAIQTTLEAKGYRRVAAEKADFGVAFDMAREARKHVQVSRVYTGGLNAFELEQMETEYEGGSLTIDVFDARTRDRLWQGTGETEFGAPVDDGWLAVEVVSAILEEFPAR